MRCDHAYSMNFDGSVARCAGCGATWHLEPDKGWHPVRRPATTTTPARHLAGSRFA